MPTLYVANCNPRQSFLLMYRLPEQRTNTPPREQRIGPMSILPIRDLTEPEAEAIEAQLALYGGREASERLTGSHRVERLFSRSPIKEEAVRKALGFNVNLMEQEGEQRLFQTAAANTVRIREVLLDQNVTGNLERLHVSVQEDSDDPKFAAAGVLEPSTEQKARGSYNARNRSRKAR